MREYHEVRKDLSGDEAAPYIGAARTLLGQLKNRMQLGGIAQLSRSATLPDGTTIIVASRLGQDTIRIIAPTPVPLVAPTTAPELVPEVDIPEVDIPLLTPETPTPKYLLVVFKNSHVAAIPMGTLTGAHWPVAYRAALKQGNLPDWVEVAQYNFGVPGCDSVFLAPFSLQATVITPDPANYWLNAARAGDMSAHAVHALQTTVSVLNDPVLGASGATILTQDGSYTAQGGVPAIQQQYGETPSVRGIGSDGTYYYAAGSRRQRFGAGFPDSWDGSNQILGGGSIEFGGGTPAALADALAAVIPNVANNTNDAATWSISGPAGGASLDKAMTGPLVDDGVTRDYSLGVPLPVYEHAGHDRFVAATLHMTGNFRRTSGFVGGDPLGSSFDYITGSQSLESWAEQFSWAAYLGGLHSSHPGEWNYVVSDTGIDFVQFSAFPPALGADAVYASVGSADGSVSLNVTPYLSTYGYGPYGWLHLSNGHHVMQGFFTTSDDPVDARHLFFDGQDVGAKLAAALSTPSLPVTLDDVQAMVMDMPLSLIRGLQ